MEDHDTGCVIVGGGPAGLIAGLVLARCGVEVTVLEQHDDFLRDFRGDTVHPSTLDALDDLGLIHRFEELGWDRIEALVIAQRDGGRVVPLDLRRLRGLGHPFMAMVPQWDFLDLLADAGRELPWFHLEMRATAEDLVLEGDRVVGVRVRRDGRTAIVRAPLVIAADGRWSVLRERSGLVPRELPVGVDALWFRVPSHDALTPTIRPAIVDGDVFIVIPRHGYAQVAHLLPKGSFPALRERGIEDVRRRLVRAVPALAAGADELSLDDLKLLDVRVTRLRRWWRPGFLCIGDAAHAMSPLGGVGINLAVQDALAAAGILVDELRRGHVTDASLARVERRRRFPTAVTQRIQVTMHRGLDAVIARRAGLDLPRALRVVLRTLPGLGAIPARLVTVGVRPERVPPCARRAPAPRVSGPTG